jgi:hypothetical protein
MQIEIRIPDIVGLFKKFPIAVTRAARKAGSSAIRAVRVESGRAVRARKQLRVRTVKASMTLTPAPPAGAPLEALEWRMRVKNVATPVSDYPYRQVRAGVSVGINKGSRGLIQSAFVATMKSGHTGVFRRVGRGRLPIKELFTTRIVDVFNDSGMMPAVEARGSAEFSSTFDRVLPMELQKVGSKRV